MLKGMEELGDKKPWRDKAAAIMTFRYLAPSELKTLMDKATLCRYGPEEPIVEEGSVDPYFYGILEGAVSVSVREGAPSGECKDVYMCALGPGDVFGEAGMFLKVKRTASVTSSDSSVVMRLHRADVGAFIKAYPSAGNKLLLVIVYGLLRKLRAANQELAYERKADLDQADVDSLLADMMGN